jgi:hypothetical protein
VIHFAARILSVQLGFGMQFSPRHLSALTVFPSSRRTTSAKAWADSSSRPGRIVDLGFWRFFD